MQIQRLTVKNFRCFAGGVWEFSPGFNFVVGAAGSGKTALLDALASAVAPLVDSTETDQDLGRPRGQDFRWIEQGKGNSLVREPCYPLSVQADVQVAGVSTAAALEHLPPRAVGLGSLIFFRANIRREPPEPLFPVRAVEPQVALPLLFYRTCERSVPIVRCLQPEAPEAGEPSRLDAYRAWRSPALPLQSTAAWFRSCADTPLLHAVREAILPCLPAGSDPTVDVRELAGLPSLATLAAVLACRCAMLNPHLGAEAVKETDGVVLVDDLQQLCSEREVQALRGAFPALQFVVALDTPRRRGFFDPFHGDRLIDLDDQSSVARSAT